MANPKRVPMFTTTYQVGAGDVFVTVVIGEQQLGTSLARLDGATLAEGAVTRVPVGSGPALPGHRLTLKSVVSDVNNMTNRTSITIKLEGGPQPAEHTLSVEVDDDGDAAIYLSEVEFRA